jgi:hypothetical protein
MFPPGAATAGERADGRSDQSLGGSRSVQGRRTLTGLEIAVKSETIGGEVL